MTAQLQRTTVIPQGEWRLYAACRELGPHLFCGFAYEDKSSRIRRESAAKKVCHNQCPVREACLESALANHEAGVWGGTDDLERKKIRRRQSRG